MCLSGLVIMLSSQGMLATRKMVAIAADQKTGTKVGCPEWERHVIPLPWWVMV